MTEKQLTPDDIAKYEIECGAGSMPRWVTAAYVKADGNMPGWVLFKDHEHRTVALLREETVVMVRRMPPVS